MTYTIRPALLADSRFIYNLSMDPSVRENSTRSDEFTFEDHERWYADKLSNGLNAIWIMEVGGVPVGQVRYGRVDYDINNVWPAAEIAISINPSHHGLGYASTLLAETMPLAREWLGVTTLVALVLRRNHKSRRLFRRAAFLFVGAEERMGKCHARYAHVR